MIIKYEDKNYPNKLRNIKNPPSKIYAVGNTQILNKFGIAVIGSRNCTPYGIRMTSNFVKGLVKYDINIISGLALGIDKYAHINTIDKKCPTIAVLPSGLNQIYPKENEYLVDKIIKTGGCVISEYNDNTEANSKRFIERNRIVSGLSDGVLIIEGGYRSGTGVTAKIAKEQNKNIFCVPSSLENPKGIVPNTLIKKGAILVRNEQDIIINYKNILLRKQENNKLKYIGTKYQKIYNILGNNILQIDEIILKSKMKVEDVNNQLLMLELEGYIEQLPGKRYRRR